MTTNIVTQDNMNTYNAEMAKIMGVGDDGDSSETKTSTLARVKIIHAPIMGMKTIDGEETETVVVKGGSYSIQMPDDKIVYGSKLTMRPFIQRYMYKKYVQGTDADNPGYFVKTIMADSLNQDLKDTHGGYNCGKPAGYIKDFKALSEDMQKLIRTIKRVRVIFGLAKKQTFKHIFINMGHVGKMGAFLSGLLFGTAWWLFIDGAAQISNTKY